MAEYTIQELHELWARTCRPARRPAQNIEHNIQAECFAWFTAAFPQYNDLYWSILNGGYRSKKTAAIMKQEGQKAGVPDTFFAYPAKGYHGLFIEMKKSRMGKRGQLIDKGHTSDYQDTMIENLRKVGYRVEVCYSFHQFEQIITDYLP